MSRLLPLSPEDQALFQKEMAGVAPLTNKKPKMTAERDHEPRMTAPKRLENLDYRLPRQSFGNDLTNYYTSPVQAETFIHYHQPGVSKRQIHALKTGRLTYQAKLDMHGLSTPAAKESLTEFLSQQIQQHHRWVLVIHGKGGRFGEAPVLKNLVNHWLGQIPCVLGFHSAQAKHGGAGAVYVLLKP